MVNGYAGLSERKFRKWVQMDANTPLCHSERSEESRGEKEEIHRFALNDKLMVNCYAWYTVSERKFGKWARINANNPLCHSEHLLLSFRTQ